MRSVTNHNILNNIPIITIGHEGLQAIKHIVAIAPQEAQWFHTVEPITYRQSPNEVHLHLSDKIYIPTQNTSAAQVDSTSMMMMDFYKDLKEEYQDQSVVNEKLSLMTCWCHSHHNMAPNPSSQDDHQFNSFISLAQDQNSNSWQIMLIFNKKDQFYSRVYDPNTQLIHEGVPIHVLSNYDFSYINNAAKTKFLKPKPLLKSSIKKWNFNKPISRHSTPLNDIHDPLHSIYLDYKDDFLNDDSEVNQTIISSILSDAFDSYDVHQAPNNQFNKSIDLNEHNLLKLHESLFSSLDDREITFFTYFISNQKNKVPPIFLDNAFKKKFPTETSVFDLFKKTLFNKTITMQDAYQALLNTLEIVDLETRKECKEYIDNDGII